MRRWIVCVAVAGLYGLAPAWALAGDQEMAQEIAGALRDSGRMKGYSIAVKYKDGVALLTGRVQSQQQKQLAGGLALQCEGVSDVINQLAVAPTEARRTLRQPRGVQAGAEESTIDLSSLETHEDAPALRRVPLSAQMPQAQQMPGGVSRTAAMRTAARTAGPVGAIHGHGNVISDTVVGGGAVAGAGVATGGPLPMNAGAMGGAAPLAYDEPTMPNYAWPTYAAYPNYAAVTYPKQYSPTVWPFIGPFYPYPQVPLGWRQVTLEWDDGWWWLDFHNGHRHSW